MLCVFRQRGGPVVIELIVDRHCLLLCLDVLDWRVASCHRGYKSFGNQKWELRFLQAAVGWTDWSKKRSSTY